MKTSRFFILTAVICIASLFSVDLAYAYHPISPYAYCLNNPVRYVDPKGEDVWEFDNRGNIINHTVTKEHDAFYMVQQVDGAWQRTGQELMFEYGTVISQNTYTFSPDGRTAGSYDVFKVRGDDQGTALFNFMANNITGSPTQVEVGQAMTGISGDRGLNFVTTSHTTKQEWGIGNLIAGQLYDGYTVRELNHSHPTSAYPSGLRTGTGDIRFATTYTDYYRNAGLNIPGFNIYHVPTGQKIPFGPNSTPAHFGLR